MYAGSSLRILGPPQCTNSDYWSMISAEDKGEGNAVPEVILMVPTVVQQSSMPAQLHRDRQSINTAHADHVPVLS